MWGKKIKKRKKPYITRWEQQDEKGKNINGHHARIDNIFFLQKKK